MINNKTIYFDMDGTIANLYGVDNWLDYLLREDVTPYEVATTMVDMGVLNSHLKELQEKGYKIGIVSWLAKDSTKAYDKAVTKAKLQWLKGNFTIEFDEVHIVPYGTPKHEVVSNKHGVIFDDDEKVRKAWVGIAINPQWFCINSYLHSMLT